jgi:hypothetical protein
LKVLKKGCVSLYPTSSAQDTLAAIHVSVKKIEIRRTGNHPDKKLGERDKTEVQTAKHN